MGIEAALITLGAAVLRNGLKLWFGDKSTAAAAGSGLTDVLAARLTTELDKRKLRRIQEQVTDAVVERVTPIVELEFPRLPDNERLAAVSAVQETLDEAELDEDDLFAADLDAVRLYRHLQRFAAPHATDLSTDATELHDLLLRDSAGYVIEIAKALPPFGVNALTEILRRETDLVVQIREVLTRLPPRRSAADFSYDYRQLVGRTLDQVEMFGASLSGTTRRYPLSVAYISLTATHVRGPDGGKHFTTAARIEDLLATGPRVFIRGEAGLGKTTLLQWIAVRSARRDFPGVLESWNDTVPFFIPLRRYAERDLPTPERFLDEVGQHIADEMPTGWAQAQLRSGKAIVLVDGVDEVAAERRQAARAWLRSLILSFPDARFVISSRPSAVDPDWLHADGFQVADLEPMSPGDVRVFAERWHEAMRAQSAGDFGREEFQEYQQRLFDQFAARHHLRKLAGYPLLCALLCALNHDHYGALPADRMELYDAALQMMLERRDADRKISPLPALTRARKTLLLGHLAHWFIANDLSDAPVARAVERLQWRLGFMPDITASSETVYRHLLERTGLLREPVEDRVDFIHRTFQEYLASKCAIDDLDQVRALISSAHLDQWHEVVVMAVGHARPDRRRELLTGLLDRGDREPYLRDTLDLLAFACLETTPELDQRLRQRIETRAARLLPPKDMAAAKSFATAGAFVLDLLAAANPGTVNEVAATIRAAAEIGVDDALPLLATFGHDDRRGVQQELVAAWNRFDPDTYAETVLADLPIESISVHEPDLVHAMRHLRHVTHVTCTAREPGALISVPAQVRHLSVTAKVAPDLSLLRTPQLTELSITSLSRSDLAPLAQLESLRKLTTRGMVTGLEGLRRSPTLRHLVLDGCDLANFRHVEPGWELDVFDVADLDRLTDLRPLAFLAQPRQLHIRQCRQLGGLAALDQWADSLEVLTLHRCGSLDLTPVVTLNRLAELDLYGTMVVDFRPLARVPTLQRLTVSSARDTQAFTPLARLPRLRELRIARGGPVDLTAFAGHRDLTVRVEGNTTVLGAELLGKGSAVTRWTDQRQ
ncbi:NACHT domain-containing protein [Saccharothrix saharensis]|uniref:NACHT domain-containing protein n=1 Tax=Saccharothrix saharensis TaxID=571190 RepID=UPI0036A913AA